MEHGPANASQVIDTSKRFARRIVAVESRLAVLGLVVKVQEEDEPLLRAILPALRVGRTRFPRPSA